MKIFSFGLFLILKIKKQTSRIAQTRKMTDCDKTCCHNLPVLKKLIDTRDVTEANTRAVDPYHVLE